MADGDRGTDVQGPVHTDVGFVYVDLLLSIDCTHVPEVTLIQLLCLRKS